MVPPVRLASVPDAEPDAASPPIRILLADDHAAMRRSLRLLLDGEADLDVVAEIDTFETVTGQARAQRADVIVLDLGMSEHGLGIEALERLSRELRSTHVVVLTTNDDPAFAQRAFENGASGLVLKEMADSDLPMAVRRACRGDRYLSPAIAGRLGNERHGNDKLTPREREVLRLIALGHTSVEVAAKLQLSPRTIETHRARIHRKLALGTRAELVRYALQQGLLKP